MSGVEEAALLAALAETDGAVAGAGALGGAAAGGAATGATTAAGTTAAEIAAEEAAKQAALQTAYQSGMAGSTNTMEGALANTGYTPSSLMNAFQYGPGSGQGMGQTMANYGQGLMSNAASPGYKQMAGKMALRQGAMGLMNQQPQQQPRPMMRQQPEQQSMQMYGGSGPYSGMMSEEEKQRLRMMGYRV